MTQLASPGDTDAHQYSTRSFEQWMEQAGYPLSRLAPAERLHLLDLCHKAGDITPQWLRLYDFDRPGILEAQHTPANGNPMLERNHALQGMIYEKLLAGLPGSDPSYAVFENLMRLQDGGRGDRITTALARANVPLNTFISNHQRQRICAHNRSAGLSHPQWGAAYWFSSLPADFAFDDTLADAEALFLKVCADFAEDGQDESIYSRLLKDAVLGDENRYWTGVAANHAYVLGRVGAFIPRNIGELELPDDLAGVANAVRRLLNLDRRYKAEDIVEQGQLLLDLYLRYARLGRPSPARHPRELAITTAVALQMRRQKAKWPVATLGQGTREVSAYQALKALASAEQSGQVAPIDPALRVLLGSVVSLALWVESEDGLQTFAAVEEHGGTKVRRTEFFARIPKRLRAYSAPTVVRILQRFEQALLANTPANPLDRDPEPFNVK